jgi:hypothetical protein
VAKQGEVAASSEDAAGVCWQPVATRRLSGWAWHRRGVTSRSSALRVVVADGASQSLLAKRWAWSLVAGVQDVALDALEERLAEVRTDWKGELDAYRTERAEQGQELAWFEEIKLAEGAAATLLIIEVDAKRDTAEIRAVGDSVAILVRDGRTRAAVPLDDPAAFTSYPALIRTVADAPTLEAHHWALERGDRIVAATDAVAAWLLALAARGPLDAVLDECGDEASFRALVDRARGEGELEDDDATIVTIEV